MIEAKAERPDAALQVDPAQAELHDRVYSALGDWAEKLTDVRPAGTKHLAADMADIYVSAEQYRQLVDRLVTLTADQREDAADMLIDVMSELDHIAWHIRSCRRRLTRVARDLHPDEPECDLPRE